MPLLIAYLIIFGIAIGISIINGIIIVYMGVPSFIATLGMEIILLGFGKWLTGGSILMFPYLPPEFKVLGKSKIAGLFPVPMIVFMIIAFCAVVFLETTFKGRHFYAVGCNFEAAKRVGININKVKFEAFLLMGMICGVAGITIASLFEAANPSIGDDAYLFPALIAALLGAVFLKEGIPNILGTVVAAVLMSGLTNGFTFLGFPLWIKEVIQGIILLLAISIVSTLKIGEEVEDKTINGFL
jgi:ribose/xylose/arabinose/galactoside ABC-type transport system permease subunit